MIAALTEAAQWLDAVGLRTWAGAGAYPWINTVHLLGLVMGVGAIGVVDLRVAGLWRAIPIAPLAHALTPVAVAGFLILIVSGVLLFAADGVALAGSETFHLKLVLIALAFANAAAFRALYARRLAGWGTAPPPAARLMAIASIGLWLAIGTFGRLIAYT